MMKQGLWCWDLPTDLREVAQDELAEWYARRLSTEFFAAVVEQRALRFWDLDDEPRPRA